MEVLESMHEGAGYLPVVSMRESDGAVECRKRRLHAFSVRIEESYSPALWSDAVGVRDVMGRGKSAGEGRTLCGVQAGRFCSVIPLTRYDSFIPQRTSPRPHNPLLPPSLSHRTLYTVSTDTPTPHPTSPSYYRVQSHCLSSHGILSSESLSRQVRCHFLHCRADLLW